MIIEEIRTALAAKASALVRRSADDMAVLMHPDFVHVTAGGRTLTNGNVAVATMVVDDRCAIGGREITETFRALSVFAYTDGRWLWAAGQTALPRLP
jgi:hypothetical protein